MSNAAVTYNYTCDKGDNVINVTYNVLYYAIFTLYYAVYLPFLAVSYFTTFLTQGIFWLFGSGSILISVKLWTLWTLVTAEAYILMMNMNILNPIPAYVLAITYHAILRQAEMVTGTGATFFLEYIHLLLPSVQDGYALLSWILPVEDLRFGICG